MSSILKHHFAMSRDAFSARRRDWEAPRDGLWIKLVLANADLVLDRVGRIEWGWINKEIYDGPALANRLKDPHTRLYDLYDGDRAVGYALIVAPERRLKQRFWGAAQNQSVIEIENLALYPGEESGGRGWSFFQLVMTELYKRYDDVYWSQSSSNYPTLFDYYKRQGMEHLASDEVADFRERKEGKVAAAKPILVAAQ